VDAVIKGDIPTWMNEGLAEYFETALFTGQGYVSGVIPQSRLERIRKQIAEARLKSVAEMMLIKHEDWNEQMKGENYDQAWSMVQFLAHAEEGKYQERFIAFARDAGSGMQWEQAWIRHFGSRVDDFEKRWREYWSGLPDHPTRDKYVEADVAILSGFLGRAAAQKQRFASVDEFFAAARAQTLKTHPRDWLPPSLLAGVLERAPKRGTWSFAQKKGGLPELVCVDEGGKTFTGRFTLRRDRVGEVVVDVGAPAAGSTRPAPARGRGGKNP
jgi:hypothetical protein